MINDQRQPISSLIVPRRLAGRLAAAVWVCLVVAGLGVLGWYAESAGDSGRVSGAWPGGSRVEREAGRVCVVVFVHPKCPCTRATVRQLERTLGVAGTGGDVRVVVFDPSGQEEGWAKTRLVEEAGALPGARVIMDRDGVEAARFGVRTSGHVLVYDGGGGLVFSGGVTPSRGHEGDCAGSEAVGAIVKGGAAAAARAPVYGCGLAGPDGSCDGKGASCAR